MKNLILYGGDTSKTRLDKDWMKILGKKELRITYMTYLDTNGSIIDHEYKRFYDRLGKKNIVFYFMAPCDDFKDIQDSDVIYLSGGNTFEFLAALRKAKLIPKLRKFVERGGLLCGMSAGAILLTSNIKLASIPKETADENEIGLKNLKALGLVDFHFCPHYETWMDKELKEFSKKVYPKIVETCSDSQRIHVWGDMEIFKNKMTYFLNGKKNTEMITGVLNFL